MRRAGYSAHVRLAAASLAVVFALALGACGDTVQERPIPHNLLESLILAPFPVYWVGGSFRGMAITEATHDPSGPFSVQYGSCLSGWTGDVRAAAAGRDLPRQQLPAGWRDREQPHAGARGGGAVRAGGDNARDPHRRGRRRHLRRQRAHSSRRRDDVVPINAVGAPGAPLARALPNTGFGATPLPSQVPARLRASG